MGFVYAIAGVILWIAIGVITFRILDHWMGDDSSWHNPKAFESGRESHAKMGFWLGPIYTITLLIILACEEVVTFFKWKPISKAWRKVMGI